MKRKGQASNHFLADRIPLICAVVWIIIFMYGPNYIANEILEPFYEQNPALVMTLFHVVVILISLALLVFFERWFSRIFLCCAGSTTYTLSGSKEHRT